MIGNILIMGDNRNCNLLLYGTELNWVIVTKFVESFEFTTYTYVNTEELNLTDEDVSLSHHASCFELTVP